MPAAEMKQPPPPPLPEADGALSGTTDTIEASVDCRSKLSVTMSSKASVTEEFDAGGAVKLGCVEVLLDRTTTGPDVCTH